MLRFLLVKILVVVGILKFRVVVKILLLVLLVYNVYLLGFNIIVFNVVGKMIDFRRVLRVRF